MKEYIEVGLLYIKEAFDIVIGAALDVGHEAAYQEVQPRIFWELELPKPIVVTVGKASFTALHDQNPVVRDSACVMHVIPRIESAGGAGIFRPVLEIRSKKHGIRQVDASNHRKISSVISEILRDSRG